MFTIYEKRACHCSPISSAQHVTGPFFYFSNDCIFYISPFRISSGQPAATGEDFRKDGEGRTVPQTAQAASTFLVATTLTPVPQTFSITTSPIWTGAATFT